MRTQPAFDTNLGSSHGVVFRVDLHSPGGDYLGTLPVESGAITQRAGTGWTGTLTIAGTSWAPAGPDDPAAGFSGAYVRIYAGQIVNQQPAWLELAQLLVFSSQMLRTADRWEMTLTLGDLLAWMAPAYESTFRVESGQSCQSAIRALIQRNRPAQLASVSFRDTTTPVEVPAGYAGTRATPLAHIDNLAGIANINVRQDWDRVIVIEPPRGQTPGTPVRTLTADTDLAEYEVLTGRDTGEFANRVELAFRPLADTSRASFSSTWTLTGSAPSAGQIRLGLGPRRLVVHRTDGDGRRRRRVLERVESGDLIALRATNGWDAIYRAVSSGLYDDDTERVTIEVELIDTDGTQPGTGTDVELSWYSTVVDDVIGVAEHTTGPLGTRQVGRVTYIAGYDGNVTQAQADARAAQVLPRMLAGWATTRARIVPDPRLQVGDTVTVAYLDGTQVAHRIVEATWPLTPDEPMDLALRTFDAQITKGL